MRALAEMGQPVRFALLVLVYHMVKTLIVVKICPAREQIPDAVWHPGKELMSADVGYLSDHWCDIGLGHVAWYLRGMGVLMKGGLSFHFSFSFSSPVLRKRRSSASFDGKFCGVIGLRDC